MKKEEFIVQNVKCGGCVANIEQGVSAVAGVAEVSIELASGAVTVVCDGCEREVLAKKLAELGYPEVV